MRAHGPILSEFRRDCDGAPAAVRLWVRAADTLFSVISFGPAKILIVLTVALIVLGPEKLPQMTRQIGKAWGDFRRFREHLEGEVRGALGEDLVRPFTPPWQSDGSSQPSAVSAGSGAEETTPDAGASDGAPGPDGPGSTERAHDRAPPPEPGQLTPLPPVPGSGRPPPNGGWDPGLAPDDPSLN
jgi:sec-independent protein translocase protein TatB